jgi:hypothetical protein
MTIVPCIDCGFDNTRMTAAGFEMIRIDDYRGADGHTDKEILRAKVGPQISEDNLPF